MSTPIDLTTVKDDLGIAAADTSNDAWLQRRIDGLWSRFQTYTGRSLTLASGWVDDWGATLTSGVPQLQPSSLQPMATASVFLRVFPVASISKVTLNGVVGDPAQALFHPATGKLLSLGGPPPVDLGALLLSGAARIEYVAGFTTLPAVLYEALIGALALQWSARKAADSGVGLGGILPSRISAIDVGEIDLDLSTTGNPLLDATLKGLNDPMLGPYATALDEFVDYRSILSATTQPSTAPLP